ncbi:MAG: sulfotransferase [Chthoniobacterales bacterium]|nr:sulfotransferase [Chthoniobacterales bacterium]
MIPPLSFDQRACFIAGQAKSGTTLLVALLDNHPELLVLPEETAYFPTVLTKYAARGRRAQFDYLTRESLSNVLFGGPCKWGRRNYSNFPREKFLRTFEEAAFDPANAREDLLVLMVKAYAATLGRSLDSIARWVEKTPRNRDHIGAVLERFPSAKILVTMRDPRAILAAQIALEKTRQTGRFSTYYVIAHWRAAARLASRVRHGEVPGLVVSFEELVCDPGRTMRRVCRYLEISFLPETVLTPTKAGQFWSGNSASRINFSEVNPEPATRWERELSEDQIGWVEWHCRDLMLEFGYQPRLSRRQLRYFVRPIPGERPREYLKSRAYSLRDDWIRRELRSS